MDRIGKYDILGELGQGGMGMVYKGRDTIIGRDVAIKVIQEKALQDATIKKRFYREARSAGRLSHPNITVVYDIGEEGETPYLVMEYLPGSDLRGLLNAVTPLTTAQKIAIAMQICAGLHYAHEHEVIHRDIKPENIRVLPDGTAKIMDFGIARIQSEGMTLTHTNMSMGTPRYMAPEQVRGEDIDRRADIFSFGVLFYELLTGAPPFGGDHVTTVIYKILNAEPAPITVEPDALRDDLQDIVEKCLAKDRDERYASFAEVLGDLRTVTIPVDDTVVLSGNQGTKNEAAASAETEMVSAAALSTLKVPVPSAAQTPPPKRPAPSTADRSATPPAGKGAREAAPSRKGLWAALGIVAVLGTAAVGYLVLGSDEDASTTEPSVSDSRTAPEATPPPLPADTAASDAAATDVGDDDTLPRPGSTESESPPAAETPAAETPAATETPETPQDADAADPPPNPAQTTADQDRAAMEAARQAVADASENPSVAPLFEQAGQAGQFAMRNYDNDNFESASSSFRRARDLYVQIRETLDAPAEAPDVAIESIEATPDATGDEAAADRALSAMQAAKGAVAASMRQQAAYQEAQNLETQGTQAYNSRQYSRAATRFEEAQAAYDRVAAMTTPEATVQALTRRMKTSLEQKDGATMTGVFLVDWSAFFGSAEDITAVVTPGNVQTTSTRAMVDVQVELSYRDNRNRRQQATTAYTWTLQYVQARDDWAIERVITQ